MGAQGPPTSNSSNAQPLRRRDEGEGHPTEGWLEALEYAEEAIDDPGDVSEAVESDAIESVNGNGHIFPDSGPFHRQR